jgi:hypothetical protein
MAKDSELNGSKAFLEFNPLHDDDNNNNNNNNR